ncbi:AAA family ATPase, partial [bacterium]|nr:AAA family ATPase [bacterium]
MRFPLFADLDSDQKRLYSKSPSDGAILVVGPPGCGKTVVAAHRTVRLSASGKPVVLLMFGKVLSKYTSNFDGYTGDTKIMHAHSFWPSWYKNAFKTQIPKVEKFIFDWREVKNLIRDCKDPRVLSALNWGHLIIDEGQDFEPDMYEALMALVQHPAIPVGERPTLSVFADDNQTITDRNSSIPELMGALNASIENNRLWRLDRNYRNTKEIASFSRYFQVRGSTSANLPERSGGQAPLVFLHKDVDQIYDQVTRYAKNHSGREIGVVVFGTKRDVTSCFNKLKARTEKQGVSCTVQGYVSAHKGKGITEVSDLVFDKPPVIT